MINQIQLSEQFEKIFIDEEVHNFYLEWHSEKNKKPPTLWDKVNNVLFVLFLLGVCFFTWNFLLKDRVEQEVRHGDFVTYVWKDMDIIQSWYTPIDSVTDSLKTAQYKAGKELLKILK